MKPSECLAALRHNVNTQQPTFLWGPSGIGKSDVFRQLGEATKRPVVDRRLSLLSPTDMVGFPHADAATKTMSFFPPDFLPKKGKGILFFDEFNTAAPAMQAACLQLVLDREIGAYKLPDGWVVMMAGNRTSDRSVTHTMPAPMANRLMHLEMEADTDEWLTYAAKKGISESIRGYMRWRPSSLTTPVITAGVKGFGSPRSWFACDKVIEKGLPPNIEMGMIKGLVGEGDAVDFIGFTRERASLPNIDMILMTPDKVHVPEKTSTQYAVVTVLETHVTENNLDRMMKYVGRMPKEMEVVFMTSAIRKDETLASNKTFIDWAAANRGILS